jgi:hypothetical protein
MQYILDQQSLLASIRSLDINKLCGLASSFWVVCSDSAIYSTLDTPFLRQIVDTWDLEGRAQMFFTVVTPCEGVHFLISV